MEKEADIATAIEDELRSLRERVSHFAQQNIAHRSDLHTSSEFPYDIWHKMSQEKLLGVGIPQEYGGMGGNYLSIAVAGEAMVRRGHNMGLALSWLTHELISRFVILKFGDSRQKNKYLPEFANGELIASFAISEPERGAHPKYLKTVAHEEGDGYVLSGEKYYLTNGPIADLFLVGAITGVKGSRKQFTVFIIPKGTAGLSLTEPMKLSFLRPSPHGGIVLRDCAVPSANILGKKGSAYDDIIIPFGELEGILSMGPIVGGMEEELELLVNVIREQRIRANDELKNGLGELKSLADTLDIMAYEAANMLDSDTAHPELHSVPLCFSNMAIRFQSQLDVIMSQANIKSDLELNLMANDLDHIVNMGKNTVVIKQRKLGESLLSGKAYNDESA